MDEVNLAEPRATSDVEPAALAREPKRSRGNFWEVTYAKEFGVASPWTMDRNVLRNEIGKVGVEIQTGSLLKGLNLTGKQFADCDINHFALAESSFRNCKFTNCRFVKAAFDVVKFSECEFERCHFLNVDFRRCQFLSCTFSSISASGEQTRFVETSLSARAFIGALTTNTGSLPLDVDAEYQRHRLLATKTKLARALLVSVRDQPELDQLFEAIECFELALKSQQIADSKWMLQGQRLVPRGLYNRKVVSGARALQLLILKTAGWLTDWGRSPAKTLILLIGAVVVFTLVYWLALDHAFRVALLRALDCTFVFGYTRYVDPAAPARFVDYLSFLNAFVGFSWYALLIPALSKRLFR